MKLILTLLARDEEDIIRQNILFHLHHGIDFIIATDNKSVDGTRDLLKEFEKQGVLKYIYEPEDNHSQWKWVTRMARMAAEKYHADWVINSDADEFWYPKQQDLKTALSMIPPEMAVLAVQRHDFVPVTNLEKPFYEKMIYRKKVSLNSLGKPLPPKIIHRAMPDMVMSHGNHKLIEPKNLETHKTNLIEILHFPVRSYKQYEKKIVFGTQAVERNKEMNEKICNTWRVLYKKYLNGEFEDYYKSIEYNPERIESELKTGDIICDLRLKELFNRHQKPESISKSRSVWSKFLKMFQAKT